MTRYLTSASLGVTMTFGLLYLMHILIDTGNAVRTYPIKAPNLSWILPQVKDSLPLVDERIEPPPPPPIPPTNKAPTSSAPSGSIGVPVVVQNPQGYKPYRETHSFTDGPLINIVRVRPTYPVRALTQNIEGFVTLGFDVTPEGAVINVIVLESSHGIFEKAAIAAIYRFRFKSRVVDGIPVGTVGLRNRFRFEIEK